MIPFDFHTRISFMKFWWLTQRNFENFCGSLGKLLERSSVRTLGKKSRTRNLWRVYLRNPRKKKHLNQSQNALHLINSWWNLTSHYYNKTSSEELQEQCRDVLLKNSWKKPLKWMQQPWKKCLWKHLQKCHGDLRDIYQKKKNYLGKKLRIYCINLKRMFC